MCGRFTLTREEWRQISDALCIQDERDAAASYRPASISRRLISASSSLRNSTAEKRHAPAGVWSIAGPGTTFWPRHNTKMWSSPKSWIDKIRSASSH